MNIQQHEIDAQIENCLQTKMRNGIEKSAIVFKIWHGKRKCGLGFNFLTGNVGDVLHTEDGRKLEILAVV
jgi:hypothetical protein